MTDKPMPSGENIVMQFHIPHNKVLVELQGRVVWVNKENSKYPGGMGIEFINCPEEGKRMLANICLPRSICWILRFDV